MLRIHTKLKEQCLGIYGSHQCENGQAPISSVPICSAILEDDLVSALNLSCSVVVVHDFKRHPSLLS